MPSYSLDRTKLLAAGGSETFGAGSLKILYFKVKSFPESGLKIYQQTKWNYFHKETIFFISDNRTDDEQCQAVSASRIHDRRKAALPWRGE